MIAAVELVQCSPRRKQRSSPAPMPDAFSFRLLATDGAARRGEIATPHGVGRHAGVHAGRHAGNGERPCARGGARKRRRHRARQHLSPDAAAGRRTHRGARRPAPIHELAAGDPHRFRRLPGHVAVAAAQGRGQRRDLPLPPRRRQSRAFARARDRDPASARLRHRHAARRMPAAAGAAGRAPSRHAAFAAPGPSAASAPSSAPPGRALFGIVQGGDDPQLRARAPASSPIWASRAMPSAGLPWASRRR